jgi:hypothetical protein
VPRGDASAENAGALPHGHAMAAGHGGRATETHSRQPATRGVSPRMQEAKRTAEAPRSCRLPGTWVGWFTAVGVHCGRSAAVGFVDGARRGLGQPHKTGPGCLLQPAEGRVFHGTLVDIHLRKTAIVARQSVCHM